MIIETLLTKKEILAKYPPKEEIFNVKHYGKEQVICSGCVSRDENGVPRYFGPARWINGPKNSSNDSAV